MDTEALKGLMALAENLRDARSCRKTAAEYGNADQRAKACHAADGDIELAWEKLAEHVGSNPETIISLVQEVLKARGAP